MTKKRSVNDPKLKPQGRGENPPKEIKEKEQGRGKKPQESICHRSQRRSTCQKGVINRQAEWELKYHWIWHWEVHQLLHTSKTIKREADHKSQWTEECTEIEKLKAIIPWRKKWYDNRRDSNWKSFFRDVRALNILIRSKYRSRIRGRDWQYQTGVW